MIFSVACSNLEPQGEWYSEKGRHSSPQLTQYKITREACPVSSIPPKSFCEIGYWLHVWKISHETIGAQKFAGKLIWGSSSLIDVDNSDFLLLLGSVVVKFYFSKDLSTSSEFSNALT